MPHPVKLARAKDIPPGTAAAFDVEGRSVAVFNLGGAFHAIDDACTHRGAPLSRGAVVGTVVTCPSHGASFDIVTGEVLGPPATGGVARHRVRVEGGELTIELSEPRPVLVMESEPARPDEPTRARIASLIERHDVLLFMKGTRQAPECGFSGKVARILDRLIPDYQTFDVLTDPAIREGIKGYSSWPTIPQLYVKGSFLGGCDTVSELYASGELQRALGVAVPAEARPEAVPSDARG